MRNYWLMHTFIALLVLVMSYSCVTEKQQAMHIVELNENWKMRQVGTEEMLDANVPGTVHTDLLNNGKIEDPFYRLNEHDLQWIDKANWEYQSWFTVSEELVLKDKVEIYFEGLDTYAKVYLNDSLILETDNMFRTYQVDCKKHVFVGANSLKIIFESPIHKGIEKHDAINYKIPVSNNDLAEIGQVDGNKLVSVFTRKAGYHFGWDWGPRLVTSGIWRPVKLKAWNAMRINNLFVQQIEIGETAQMMAHIEVEAVSDIASASFTINVNGNTVVATNKSLQSGMNSIQVPFEIENPQRWWPNGLGDQVLYNIEAVISDEAHETSVTERIGLRDVELVMEPDSIGTSFYFKVNGHPVFMKGANYIPQDVFLPRADQQKYKHILQSAKDANMNMLRVWGGGIYENDEFYDMCDEMGLLVWQDFMFACAMFPGDEAFLESVKQEAIDNVKRLRNHTSIALWCGNNEILSAWENWGWKDTETKEQSKAIADTIWTAYDNIFHKILPEVVAEYDADRAYWPSSPGSAFGEKEDAQGTKGDMHYWGVWWGKEPFANYEVKMPRFMSEFGFQSFPELLTVEQYASPEDYDIYSDVMKSHQRSTIGNGTIKEYMLRHYKDPKDFESFLYVSHLLQAQGIGFGIEAHRRNMHHCMGSLYWQINDCWPVASWSGIDYYGKWKALHYEVKRKFNEQIISFKQEDDCVLVYVVSDALKNKPSVLSIQVFDFNGEELNSFTEEINVKANSAGIYAKIEWQQLLKGNKPNSVVIKGTLHSNDVEITQQFYYPDAPKNIDWPNAELKYEITEKADLYEFTIRCNKLARGVFVSAKQNGNFSDNYFDLLPGDVKVINLKKEEGMTIESLKRDVNVMSIVDSY